MLSAALICATVQTTLYSATHKCAVKCQEIAEGHWNCIEIAKVPFASLAVRVQVEQFTMLDFEMIFELLPLLPPLTCSVCIFSEDMLTINFELLVTGMSKFSFSCVLCEKVSRRTIKQSLARICLLVKRLQVWRLKMHRSVPAFHVVRVVSEGVMLNCW